MQWDASPNAGFTPASPWLPLTEDWRERNVDELISEPDSILDLYRKLLAVRRGSRALQTGDYKSLPGTGGVLAYLRTYTDESIAVILNLTGERRSLHLPEGATGTALISTGGREPGSAVAGLVDLDPDEGIVIALTG
jgi:alpha-glucosidase